MTELLRRAPRLEPRLAEAGVAPRSRWWLEGIAAAVPWLRGRPRSTVHRTLRRLGVRYKRGRACLHSPDPDYDAKVAAVAAARAAAAERPGAVVLLYEDELTYHRRPTVDRAYAARGAAATVPLGLAPNRRRRVAACLDATTGRVLAWQRHSFRVPTFARFLRAVAAAYPDAEAVYVALDNWPVHRHPDVLAALAGTPVELLPLPTYAPWTNPAEDVWRALKREVLHHHGFGDDWAGLQGAVAGWLDRWADGSPELLRATGLCPP